MLKRISLIFFVFIFLILSIYINKSLAQNIKIEGKKVDYILPYPGILPDNPIYFLKATRDQILKLLTRDDSKKVQLYLLFSDKRIGMAQKLADEGKWQLAASTLRKGELYMSYIPGILQDIKKQGSNPPPNFILNSRLSSEKHQEIMEDLLTNAPEDQRQSIEESLKINLKTQKQMSSL